MDYQTSPGTACPPRAAADAPSDAVAITRQGNFVRVVIPVDQIAAELINQRHQHMLAICGHTRDVIALDAQLAQLEPKLTATEIAELQAEVEKQDEAMLDVLTGTAGNRGEELSRGC